MFDRDFGPFVPPQFVVRTVGEPWELAAAKALRRQVFCEEQRLFEGDDGDAADASATTIVALDELMGMPHRVVGTVRIHESRPGEWYGSRLAIERAYRSVYGLGTGLIHRAVGTAIGRGCRHFFANVQRENVPLFRRLAWEPLEEFRLNGHPHVRMRADLAFYAARAEGARADLIRTRRAS